MGIWFEYVASDYTTLSQGDILLDCPVFFPAAEVDYTTMDNPANVTFVMKNIDVVVMTQSCDIQQGKPGLSIMLCPLAKLSSVNKEGHLPNLVTDRINSMHLLKNDSGPGNPEYRVVDFNIVYNLPLGVLNNWKKKAHQQIARLKSPYLELMSQRFAYKLMRVGTEDADKINLDDLKSQWRALQPTLA